MQHVRQHFDARDIKCAFAACPRHLHVFELADVDRQRARDPVRAGHIADRRSQHEQRQRRTKRRDHHQREHLGRDRRDRIEQAAHRFIDDTARNRSQ
jgi:hypothetical protein